MIKDKLLTLSVLASLGAGLWGARIGFLYFVGDHWIGTFGVTSAVLGTITYLSWKGKLGKWGIVFKKALTNKISKKFTKSGIFIVGFTLFFLVFFSIGIHASSTIYAQKTESFIEKVRHERPELLDAEQYKEQLVADMREKPIETTAKIGFGFLLIPVLGFFSFPEISAAMGATNQMFGSQMIHVIDIVIIQEIEALAVLLFTKRMQNRIVKNIN